MIDDEIRAAVHELIGTAPAPRSYESLPAVGRRRSHRPLAFAAAAVLVVGGGVFAVARRADAPDSVQSDTLAPTVTSAPFTPPAATTTPVPDTTTELIFGRDDVIATHDDGDLWWHPGLLGDAPGEPVRLIDVPSGQSVVHIGGRIGPGGKLLLVGVNDVNDESGNGELLALPLISPPPLPAVEEGYGAYASASPDGTRIEDGRNEPRGPLLWSQDGASVFWAESDSTLTWLIRASADSPSEVTGRLERYQVGIDPIGWDPVGNLVLTVYSRASEEDTHLLTVDPAAMMPVEGVWDGTRGDVRTIWALSPEGDRALRIDDGVLSVVDLAGEQRTLTDGIAQAWFAPTTQTATPTPDTPSEFPATLSTSDVLAVREDGEIWWFPNVLEGGVADPVVLFDPADPEQIGGFTSIDPGEVSAMTDGTIFFGAIADGRSIQFPLYEFGIGAPDGTGVHTQANPAGDGLVGRTSRVQIRRSNGNWSARSPEVAAILVDDVRWTPDGAAVIGIRSTGEGEPGEIARFEVDLTTVTVELAATTELPANAGTTAQIVGFDGSGLLMVVVDDEMWLLDPQTLRQATTRPHPFERRADSIDGNADGAFAMVADGGLFVRLASGAERHLGDGFTYVAIPVQDHNEAVDQLETYLDALAEGRYDAAAALLGSSVVEPRDRLDLRPLYREYGAADDLATSLEAWCRDIAICDRPSRTAVAGVNRFTAIYETPAGPATAYYTS